MNSEHTTYCLMCTLPEWSNLYLEYYYYTRVVQFVLGVLLLYESGPICTWSVWVNSAYCLMWTLSLSSSSWYVVYV